MYIDKIDDYIFQIIDDFYSVFISKNKIIDKIIDEQNFIQFQKDLNTNLIEYFKKLEINDVRKLFNKEESFTYVYDIVKKYVSYYLFVHISYFYKYNEDILVNNIVEFANNQPQYNFKVKDFFNPDSNSKTIEFYKIVKNIYDFFKTDNAKEKDKIKNNFEFKSAAALINNFDESFFINLAKLNKNDFIHNLIKIIIFERLYKEKDKKEIVNLIEVQDDEGEYIYIDVVMPQKEFIDFSTVESLLTKKELIAGLADTFWNFIKENDVKNKKFDDSLEQKILYLINAGIVVPIVDDFLLYHKDSEKYDKIESSDPKKKDDTKIKYIVNKIDRTTELYSQKVKSDQNAMDSIYKNFYVPLHPRKAILVNNSEEIKSITKLINQGGRSLESNEFVSDLINYRIYPYVNFKEFENNGFTMLLNKTTNLIRSVSFSSYGTFKQNPKDYIQARVGSKDMFVNIVGFMIPNNLNPIQTIKSGKTSNIHKYNKNGYNGILETIDHNIIKNKETRSNIYWYFNPDIDKVKFNNYELSTNTENMSNADRIKNIIGKMYHDIMEKIYFEIDNRISDQKNVEIQKAFYFKELVEKRTIKIKDEQLIEKLEEKIYYEKAIKTKDDYDDKYDVFYGLSSDLKKLQDVSFKTKRKIKTIPINIAENKEQKEQKEEIEEVVGICQHNIDWDYLTQHRQADPNKFTDKLYEFIQQYVAENTSGEFVCKSCSFFIDIKKYITDGTFDENNNFVPFGTPLVIPLEDIQEYSKFRRSIQSLDKLIDKISSITKLPYFSGKDARSRRKNVIKDLIDLLLVNFEKLKPIYKSRNEMSSKLYGISRNLSQIFAFEFENSIFEFTAREKDIRKNIKQNNIISYLILLIIFEISESQITYLSGDLKGFCNYTVFDKYGHTLFDGLKIRINRNGDVDNVKNYKVFCYLLYIFSCMVTKYNMWHFEDADQKDKKKKFNPMIQKFIIHTTLDIFNCILEFSESKQKGSYIYDVISTKIFNKINTMFNKNEILNKFKTEEKSSIAIDRKTYVLTKSDKIELSGKFEMADLNKTERLNKTLCYSTKGKINKRITDFIQLLTKNNLTNCPTGEFHKWKGKDKFICQICNQEMDKLKLDDDSSKIDKNYRLYNLKKLSQTYCIQATVHKFYYDPDKKESVCKICNKSENYKYSDDELEELQDNLLKQFNKTSKIIIKSDNNPEIKDDYVKELETQYKNLVKPSNKYEYIETFVKDIKNTIGSPGDNISLIDNVYIIDHDYDGSRLKKNIVISEKDNKIIYRPNHPFFKTDVYYFKNVDTEIYYDAISKIHLGYKESSKNYVKVRGDNKLIINYSILNKLKLLGYESKYININNLENFEQLDKDEKEFAINDIISNIIRDRIKNLKKIIYEAQRFIYRIKYKYITEQKKKRSVEFEEGEIKEELYDLDGIDATINKYIKKINEINVKKNNQEIFSNWNQMIENIFLAKNLEINFSLESNENKIIDTEDISKIDSRSNLLLYYIIKEFNQLLDINENKFIKTQIVALILEFIEIFFNMFNIETRESNLEYKRFIYRLESIISAIESENIVSGVNETDEVTGEVKEEQTPDETNIKEEEKEEEDALDLDIEAEDVEEISYTMNDD